MSRVVWVGSTPIFEARLMQNTKLFPSKLPDISPIAKKPRDHYNFFRKKELDNQKKYTRSLIDFNESADLYINRFNNYYNRISSLMTEYDKKEVLPSTCALGYWKTASTDLDNVGVLGLDSDVEYSDDVMDAVLEFYVREAGSISVEALNLSMTRGKFIGWPYMIGGMNRELNNLFMALSASISLAGRKEGGSDSLEWIQRELRTLHGDSFAIEGSRTQHTVKEIPVILREGVFSTTNVNPRYRIINMDPKVGVFDVRMEIKAVLEMIKRNPIHTQDRSEIRKRIENAIKSNWRVISVDHSKFDFRHGGVRGLQQIKLHGRMIKSDKYVKSSTISFKNRFISYAKSGLYEFPGDVMLKSGLGNTTLIGCTGNLSGFIAALSHELKMKPRELIAQRGKTWDALMWGDDCVAMFSDPSWEDKLYAGFTHFKLKAEAEVTIKYLGSNYERGDFKGTFTKGYSVGRAFQQQFFPERPKVWPFTTIGYIARLDLMGEPAKEFHQAMLSQFEDLDLGPRFAFQDRHTVLKTLIPEIEKRADKISMLDDVLNVFTHGLNDMDVSDLDMPEEYSKLLGLTGIMDVTDPGKYLTQEVELNAKKGVKNQITPDMIKEVSLIANGDMSRYPILAGRLVNIFKLNWPRGSVFY